MENKNYKVVLVDDDMVMLDLHSAYLEQQDYSILTAKNGCEALEVIQKNIDQIGLIITDVSMPEMDGYELCEKLKENSATLQIPVIFVSGLTSMEEKLKVYSVGADDYLLKPVDEKELLNKVKVLIGRQVQISDLKICNKESQTVAMQAMTFSSELGMVIEFYKNMWSADDYEHVASNLFEMAKSYELICTLQIHTPTKVLNYCENGMVSPLEANVIEMARKKERFFDFGSRTIINYEHFSLLIKNMPVDEIEKYGRIKDIFGMIVNGLEIKINQLNSEAVTEKKDKIIKSIKNSITFIEQSYDSVQKESILSIEDLNDEIQEAITVLCLQEYQEDNIQKIVSTCLDRINKSFYKGISIRENLENINDQFQMVLGN